MKIKITENKLRNIVNETIKEMIKENYQPSSMDEIKHICDLLTYRLNLYKDVMEAIPNNTELIINNLTNKLNELNVNAQILSYKYNTDYLTVIVNGNFNMLEKHPNYNPNEMEVEEFIGEILGQYDPNVNYGNNGIMASYLRGIYLGENQLIVEFEVNEIANPTLIEEMFHNFEQKY
jgi:hypothetical protein